MLMMKNEQTRLSSRRGAFTLIELLLVIGIIGILAAIIIVAINPSAQLQDAKDAKRRSDLRTIADAVYQYIIDEGRLPPDDPDAEEFCSQEREICDNSLSDMNFCVFDCGRWLYPLVCTVDNIDCHNYMVDIPTDPDGPDLNNEWGSTLGVQGTMYFISVDEDNRITVTAPRGNGGEGISISR